MDDRVYNADSLKNFTAQLGTSRDKRSTATYERVRYDDEQLVNAFQGSWLPRKIVMIPAEDSFSKWRSWQAEQGQIEAIEAEEKRLQLQAKITETKIKARLFGGAALYISVGDRDPSKPLDPERIKKGGIKFLHMFTRRHLSAGDIDWDPDSEFYGKPLYYELTKPQGGVVKIHPSRLAVFYGAPAPDVDLNQAELGWGDSVLNAVMDAIKDADATAANIASLVYEAKIDVVKIPNFLDSMGDPVREDLLMKRFSYAMMAKGNNGALLLDGEEEYEQKTVNFGSLTDVLMAFMQIVSGAADIPVTRLLGQSPAGLNSTGEGDLANYYDHIKKLQTIEIEPAMAILDECLIRSALGDRPEAIYYEWRPLREPTAKEKVEIGKLCSEIITNLNATGLWSPDALALAATNMLTEQGVMPGLESAVEETGGHIDFEAKQEEEDQREIDKTTAIAEATAKSKPAPAK